MNIVIFKLVVIGVIMQISDFGRQVIAPSDIKGRPFEAQYEQISSEKMPDGQTSRQIRTGRIYRDSEGRSRKGIHQDMPSGMNLNFVVIYDPVRRTLCTLDEGSKTVTEMPIPALPEATGAQLPSVTAQAESDSQIEDLGQRQIEGLVCRGRRIKRGATATEYWYSEDLKEVLFETTVSGHVEKTFRLYDVRRVEPDRDLFSVPADYKYSDAEKKVK